MSTVASPISDPSTDTDDITFTGERFLLSEPGPIRLEHMHRYIAACSLIRPDMTVLDIACGEGYGSALMTAYAHRVIGVDIDPDTVRHARKKYATVRSRTGEPVSFLPGECVAIPADDHSIDLLVSFETLEHHDQHEAMMTEVRRVLKPNGLLLLSSPNRAIYTEEAGYANPYHVKELDRDELMTLLSGAFPFVRLLGQATQLGSFLFAENRSKDGMLLPDGARCDIASGTQLMEERLGETSVNEQRAARYYIAVSGDEESQVEAAAQRLVSCYFDPREDSIARLEAAYQSVLGEARKLQAYVPELETGFHRVEDELKAALAERQLLVAEREALTADRDALRARLEQIEAQTAFRVARRAGLIKDGR